MAAARQGELSASQYAQIRAALPAPDEAVLAELERLQDEATYRQDLAELEAASDG